MNGNSERSALEGLEKPRSPKISEQSKLSLPAAKNQHNEQSNSATPLTAAKDFSSIIPSTSDKIDLVLPTKVFKSKKTSVNDLDQAVCSYLWFRRIKEIFLVMGKQNDAFSRFDMELARTDMIQTCEQYLESERPKGGGSDLVCSNALLTKKKSFFPFVEQSGPN
jgi:hypothetical protein